MKFSCAVVICTFGLVIVSQATSGQQQLIGGRRVATVYDILSLIYRLCVTEGDQRVTGLQCVDYHMGAEVSEVLEQCMVNHRIRGDNLNQTTTTTTTSTTTTGTSSTANITASNVTNNPASLLTTGVDRLCDKLTLVEEWTEKHTRPPHQLTTVIGIEALGRMTCVMGSVQRPLPTWTAAFSKCFASQGIETARGKTKNPFSASDNL